MDINEFNKIKLLIQKHTKDKLSDEEFLLLDNFMHKARKKLVKEVIHLENPCSCGKYSEEFCLDHCPE